MKRKVRGQAKKVKGGKKRDLPDAGDVLSAVFNSEERVRVVKVLLEMNEALTVEDIAEQTQIHSDRVEDHLIALRKVGLVRDVVFNPRAVFYFKWVILDWKQLQEGIERSAFWKVYSKGILEQGGLTKEVEDLTNKHSRNYDELVAGLNQWFVEHEVTSEIDKLMVLVWVATGIPEDWVKPLDRYFLSNLPDLG